MSFVPFSICNALAAPSALCRAISPNGAPCIPTSRDGLSHARVASASLRKHQKNQVVAERRKQGRHEETTFLIIDAQSVRNTDTAMEKGYDAGKKVSGIKRHIAVDTQGLPHALAVTTADVTDRKGCLLALKRELDNLGAVQKILADGGYTGKAFASSVQELMGAEVEVVKRNELHRFAVLPKRWVVERSFSWLEKNRRLWKNCERKLSTSLQMVVLAFLGVLLRRP